MLKIQGLDYGASAFPFVLSLFSQYYHSFLFHHYLLFPTIRTISTDIIVNGYPVVFVIGAYSGTLLLTDSCFLLTNDSHALAHNKKW